ESTEASQWAIWHPEGEAIIAAASADVDRLETNQHIVWFHIAVLPEFRRQGLARSLLASVVALAQQEGRRLLLSTTSERVPAGAAFMQRLGASRGLVSHTNQLVVAEL